MKGALASYASDFTPRWETTTDGLDNRPLWEFIPDTTVAGVPDHHLGQVDLLRNAFFMILPTKADEVYREIWQPMEKRLGNDELELFSGNKGAGGELQKLLR